MRTFLLRDNATPSPCNYDGVLTVWLTWSWHWVPPSQPRAIELPTTRGHKHGHGKTVQRSGWIRARGNTMQRFAGPRTCWLLVYVNVGGGRVPFVRRFV